MWKSIFLAGMLATSIASAEEVILDRGESIPISFHVEGEVASLDGSDLTLHRKLHVRIEEEEMLFSLDGKQWKPFEEFFTGQISVSFHQDEGEVMARLAIWLNLRK